MINPCGELSKIRVDQAGDGHYLTSRGDRLHRGIDLTVVRNMVVSPIDGIVRGEAYPYASDLSWMGIVIENKDFVIKMFYLVPDKEVIGKEVRAWHSRIGTAQRISKKYPGQGMIDHIHLEVRLKAFTVVNSEGILMTDSVTVNPQLFIEGLDE